jgi:NAD(P)-dependent dehydrogenase (short-subunit alcohol dehydrogenase family)
MTDRLKGKRALITGAAQGLGAAIAHKMALEGAKVTLTDVNITGAEAQAEALNQSYGAGTAFAFEHDVTNPDHWTRVSNTANEAMGGVNVLVNNAGVGSLGNIETETYKNFRRIMTIDVDSIFLGTQACIPYMKSSGPGSIINISSIAGLIASGNYIAYNTAKAAVWMMSKSIGLHLAESGLNIRSNSVHPVFIDTPILDGFREMFGAEEAMRKLARQIPLGRVGEPDDVAWLCVYLASDESKFVTAAEFKVDAGISAR